ncbi:hypothetical protein QFC21_006709 [Naganishia friedmannii]|uniref:Uncharacterized protein n=1 Tax=Naganishia friedmannii TaxID=89922 RepID=A0ACC2V0J5_9TREE|nr:hypothetical protein QFC21_006709 [Naganishia friedmannii]
MSNQQKQQTVYRLPKQVGYRSIQTHTEPIPEPTKHEVLIKIKALSLNYRDFAIANGTYPFPVKPDVVPLSDCAGEIIDAGSAVDTVRKGDKVVVSFDPTNQYGPQKNWHHGHGGPIDGFLREYAVVPATAVVKIPEESKLGWPQLASLVCTGVTTWNALFGPVSVKPGQVVLVQGTGGVSMTALILCKAFGCSVIVTSSSDDKLQFVQEKYGADHVINYRTTPAWGKEALKLTNGEGVDAIIENGGAGTIEQSLEALKMGGLIAIIGFLAKPDVMPDVALGALSKGAIVRGITVGAKQYLEELVTFVCARGLEIPVDKVFRFDQVQEAYAHLESGSHVGKVCIEL